MRFALDTSVLISHLKGDEFASQTGRFLRWASRSKHKLVVSDVVYAELYTGVILGSEPATEEKRV